MIMRTVGKLSALSSAGMLLLVASAQLSTGAGAQKGGGNRVNKADSNSGASENIHFEVASITPLKPGMNGAPQTFRPTPDGYRSALTVSQMIMLAYGPSDPQMWRADSLTGGPVWVGNYPDWYVVNARVSDADREAWSKQGSRHELLSSAMRELLKDRFKLEIHEKPTQIEGYELLVRKGGAKLRPTPAGSALPEVARFPMPSGGGFPMPSGGVRVAEPLPDHGNRWRFYGATISDLIDFLSLMGHPVHDATGLTGRYDFTLQLIDSPSRDPDEEIYNWPVDHLGLELKPTKIPGSIVVVDHIEKPSQN